MSPTEKMQLNVRQTTALLFAVVELATVVQADMVDLATVVQADMVEQSITAVKYVNPVL
jgi:hypothetical protein